jgi:hypothetical protein
MPEKTNNEVRVNPLLSVLRQPKIYIRLPSQGKYWKEGSLNISVSGEYPVYSMTARDELLMKTPDALLNGEGIAQVIQNCVPNVLDAWECPQVDVDTLLIAIRLATYGELMSISVNHPSIKDEQEFDYEINIREILDQRQSGTTWEDRLEVRPDLVVYLKPLTYRTQTNAQIGEFETQRIMRIVQSTELSEDEKVKAFQQAFMDLTKKTISIIGRAVYKIESTAGVVEDAEYIDEFITQCDADIFEKIKKRLGILNDANKLQPMIIRSTPDMIEAGAPETIEVPFTFDQSNFFG